MTGRLLTARDVSDIIGCGINKAYELLKSDCFPTIRINSRMYVLPERFEQWLDDYTGKKYLV